MNKKAKTSSAGREWLVRIVLLAVSLLFSLLIVEIVLRVFFPLYGGRDNIALDGRRIRDSLEPGTVYRQFSNEYDALTTITAEGYRAPAVEGNPDVLFVGDSFTFGWGLPDDETFASIFCAEVELTCANLGMPGSGTTRQVERLKSFIDDFHWRPKKVMWFFFGMSGSFSSGNDFNDNYDYGRQLLSRAANGEQGDAQKRNSEVPREEFGFGRWLISWQTTILDNVHLMRHVKYHWGPLLRTLVLAPPEESRKAEALMFTQRAFQDLDELSRQAGFEYEIFLIVPAQDILLDTHPDTLAVLSSVAPKAAISTAPLFLESPGDFYFSYDGHINPKGSRRIAEFLIARERGADAN